MPQPLEPRYVIRNRIAHTAKIRFEQELLKKFKKRNFLRFSHSTWELRNSVKGRLEHLVRCLKYGLVIGAFDE